jgi:hypothetical protein
MRLLSGVDTHELARVPGAARLGPPRVPAWWRLPAFVVGLFLVITAVHAGMYALYGDVALRWTSPLFLLLLALPALVARRYRSDLGRWRASRASWERTRVCDDCGAIVPPADH